MNKILLEIFLEYCGGISIEFKNRIIKMPTRFIDKFSYEIRNDAFIIINELEEDESFIINNLDQCKVEEFEDHIAIHSGDNEIIIEELV